MSIEIIQERRRVTERDYSLEFRRKDDPNAGLTFPCDENGSPMRPNAKFQLLQLRLTVGKCGTGCLVNGIAGPFPESVNFEITSSMPPSSANAFR